MIQCKLSITVSISLRPWNRLLTRMVVATNTTPSIRPENRPSFQRCRARRFIRCSSPNAISSTAPNDAAMGPKGIFLSLQLSGSMPCARIQALPRTPYQTAPKIHAATAAAGAAQMPICMGTPPVFPRLAAPLGVVFGGCLWTGLPLKAQPFRDYAGHGPQRYEKMAQVQELKVEARAGRGKGPSFQARQQGLIPAVVYGGTAEPETVAVDGRTLERHIEKGAFLTTLLMLDIAGKKTRVIPRQLQLDPVSDRPVHVDFMRLAAGAKVRLEIPVHFKGQGESPGLKKGGVLNIVRHEMELVCPADAIPNEILIDVSSLDINESLHINDISLPAGAKPTIRGRDFTICSIVAPTSVIEEQRAAAAAPAPPAPRAAAGAG